MLIISNKKWITDGNSQKLIDKNKINEFIAQGWELGTLKKFSNVSKQQLENLINKINKQEFEEYYTTNPDKDVIKFFNLSNYSELHKLTQFWCVKRTKEQADIIRKKSCIESYRLKSDEEKQEFRNKQLRGMVEKYGVENSSQIPEIKDKIKNTFMSKYGRNCGVNYNKSKQTLKEKYGEDITNVSQLDFVKEKIKQSIQDKYGVDYITQSEYFKEKSRSTWHKKYGTDNPMKNTEIKTKQKDVMLEKYGVECALTLTKHPINSKGCNSVVNSTFAGLLDKNNIGYEREFRIKNRTYDFKINDILVELNPTPTHNVDWNPWSGIGLDTNYHIDKTKLANDNGYQCIHIWDWDSVYDIIDYMCNKDKFCYGISDDITITINNRLVECIKINNNKIILKSIYCNVIDEISILNLMKENDIQELSIYKDLSKDISKYNRYSSMQIVEPQKHHQDLGYGIEVDVYDCGYVIYKYNL